MKGKSLLLLVKKIITASALISMLFQSALPFTYAFPVYAQEVTPTDTVAPTSTDTTTVTPTDTTTPTQAPTDTITPTPTDTTTVTPTADVTVTPTDTTTITPTDTVTDTPTPDVQNPTNQPTSANTNSQAPPSNNSNNNSNVTPTQVPPTPTATPTPTTDDNGVVSSTIVKNVSAPSLDLSSPVNGSSATITTNKSDYSPTDTAVISGSGFLPNKAYTLEITSSDTPAVDFTTTIQMDDQGAFVYAYQLDGNYRPNYTVYVKNSDNTVATTTFTDSVLVAPASGGTNISTSKAQNGSSPAFTTLGNIVLTEQSTSDFADTAGTTKTLILTAPSNWVFKAGTGSVSATNNKNIAGGSNKPTISVTSTTITVSFQVSGTDQTDALTISGIQVEAIDSTSVPSAGSILRTAGNPGTATVNGVTNGTTDFGDLSQAASATPTPTSAVTPTPTSTQGNSAANLEQCHNENGGTFADCKDPSSSTNTWGSGNAGSGNAKLFEGNSQNYRLILTNMPVGTPVTIGISQQFTKGGKMAYDFPTGPGNLGTATGGLAGVFPCDDNAGGLLITPCPHTVPSTMSSANLLAISSIPNNVIPDTTVSGEAQTAQSNYYATPESTSPTRSPSSMYVYGATTTGGSNGFGSYSFNGTAAQVSSGDTDLKWTFTVTPTNGTVIIAWGAHISKGGDYGTKGTAVTISGSPYHTILDSVTGQNVGNQEMQMAAGAILPQPGLATQVSSAAITLGQSVTDTATYTEVTTGGGNQTNGVVSGATQFYVCGPGSVTPCTSTSNPVGSAVTNSGDKATSSSFTPTQLGTYCFAAYYTPDTSAQYASTSSTVTTNECVTVSAPPTGSLTIHKQDQSGNPMSGVTFTISGTSTGSAQTDASGNVTFSNIATGPYTVTETVPTNYHWTSTSGNCSNANPASVTVSSGATASCTFVNTRDTGSVVVHKAIDTSGSGTFTTNDTQASVLGFTWTLSGYTAKSFGTTINNVPTGNNTVTENIGSQPYSFVGWYTTGSNTYSCTNPQGTTFPITVGVAYVSTTDITLCNQRQTGTITLNKIWSGTPGQTTLQIGTTAGAHDVANVQTGLNGGTPLTTSTKTVTTGTYYVSESGGLTNYSSSLVCTDQNGAVTVGANNSVTVTNSENVVCTFTNTRNTGTLVITKYASGGDGTQTFNFSVAGASSSSQTITPTTASGTTYSGSTSNITVDTGTYSVTETSVPTGWVQTGVGCTDMTTNTPLSSNTNFTVSSDHTVNCTFYDTKYGSISGSKFNDLNGNGTQDSGETGIQGWTEYLSGTTYASTGYTPVTVSQQTTTDASGNYSFTNLLPGDYTVCEATQTGWTQTYPDVAHSNYSCANTTNGYEVALQEGPNINTTGKIFGNQGRGTLIINKTTVGGDATFNYTVTGPTSSSQHITTTGNTGTTGSLTVGAGTYSVSEASQTGWDLTSTICVNNSTKAVYPSTAVVVPVSGTVTCTFTNTQRGGVTVTKYQDSNANGTKDSGESVLSGWTINLASNSGTVSLVTDTNGQVSFVNVIPGTYTLSETIQKGWYQSNISCTGDRGIDSTNSHTITVVAGQTLSCQIGNYQNGAIVVTKVVKDPDGNVVTNDTTTFPFSVNGGSTFTLAGGQTSNAISAAPSTLNYVVETPNAYYTFQGCTSTNTNSGVTTQNGIVVNTVSAQTTYVTCTNQQQKATITLIKEVLKSDGQTVDTTDTTPFTATLSGTTMVGNLFSQGTSIAQGSPVQIQVNPGSYSASELTGNDYTLFSNSNPDTNPVTVGSNGSATITIVNEQLPGSISGYKYKADGITGIAGWLVSLLTCSSGFTGCSQYVFTHTDNNGFYSFSNLISGFYQVVEDTSNPAYTAMTATSHNVTIAANTNSTNNNFSNFKNISVTACKLEDADGSLLTTNDQTAVSGWTVHLLTDGKVTDTKQTDSAGCYTWTNLGPSHDYAVSEDVTAGWTALTPTTNDFGTAQDGINDSYTFINFNNISISGFKFNDANGNGVWDSGETGIAGWTIQLEDTKGNVIATTATDASGAYSFTNLGPGTYRVREVQQSGWTQTTANPADIVAQSGLSPEGVDFGNRSYGTVVVTKFEDKNGNGSWDSGEGALSGWTINLGTNSAVTDTNGQVTFNPVYEGTSNLSETIQNGWEQTNMFCQSSPVTTATPTPTQSPISFGSFVPQAFASIALNTSNNYPVTISSANQTVYCYIANRNTTPIITISKVNNTGGNNKGPGDLVLYTITVTATQSAADNVTVTDLLPQGIAYQSGSWTANSNVRGDLKTLGITTEPTYHSPGTWQLGDMAQDETVTLTLLAAVTNVEPGDYKDVTWAQGQSIIGNTVLALAQPTGYVDTNFVGTDVNVINSQPITSYNATQSLIQSVLGAELPATGANTLWIDLAISLLLLGFSSVMIGRIIRRKYHV